MNTPSQIPAPAFVHNLDTCVGCHACVIACANENELTPGRFWRQIVSFNPSRVPDLPVYHLSLACNHCLDAPCLTGCPASAIVRNEKTGAVLIDDAKCIGCRYCSWVCPFDAPQFNAQTGVMEKCTFCNHRLLEGSQPACTSMCPTGALALKTYGEIPGVPAAGFPEADIRPAMSFLPMRGRIPQPAPPDVEIPDEGEVAAWIAKNVDDVPDSKVSLKSEWPLAVFTFTGIALVSWFLVSLAGGSPVNPEILGLLGLSGMGLSTMHLGRKSRAWRAILNWRTSWLSREVIAYTLFLIASLVSTAILHGEGIASWTAGILGALLLVTFDGVYASTAREWKAQLDAQSSVLSAAFLVAVMAGDASIAILTGLLRLYAVADRTQKRKAGRGEKESADFLSIARVVIGIVGPAAFWMVTGKASPLVIALALIGEFADRIDFYASLDITTPRRSMAKALRDRVGENLAR